MKRTVDMKRLSAVLGVVAGVALAPLALAADAERGPGGTGADTILVLLTDPGPRPATEPPAMLVATRLAAAETLIGIRAAQLGPWRDFSDALLALLEPPAGPRAAAAGFDRIAGPGGLFAGARHLADEAIVRADALNAAIAALAATLAPDQRIRAALLDLPLPPLPGGAGRFEAPFDAGPIAGPPGED
jgi:hypothetical protein